MKLEHTRLATGGAIKVSHEHSVDPAAFAAFRGDLLAAGLGHLLPDGGAEPVDFPPAAPCKQQALPPAH